MHRQSADQDTVGDRQFLGGCSSIGKELLLSQFDQRGQQIGRDQYNVGHDLNFGAVQNPVDLVSELGKLTSAITQARQEGILDKKKATDVEYQVTKAAQEAEEPNPDKKTILDHLKTAKSFIEDIAAAGGLVTAIVGAIEAVQKIIS
jgi:hypothetical protein